MSNERLLNDDYIMEQLWGEATDEHFREGWTTHEQADFYGRALGHAVIKGEMGLLDLRQLARDANAAEREAIQKVGGDIERFGDSDYFAYIAIRIANQSLQVGLGMVKNRRLRDNLTWQLAREAATEVAVR